jgi:macrophage erythroblast attacher
MKERLDHLSLVEGLQSPHSAEFSRWSDTRLDRWLIDWTLRTGREQTARKIAREKKIEVGVSLSPEGETYFPVRP